MKLASPRNLVACFLVAFVGYALAFAGATGALFAALLSIGVAGELGFWAGLWSRFRRVDGEGRARSR